MNEVAGVGTGPAASGQREHIHTGRRVLRAAMFGFFVDMYDVYLPVVALAPAIGYFTGADADPVTLATSTPPSSPRRYWAARSARSSSVS